jgi:glutaredoxin
MFSFDQLKDISQNSWVMFSKNNCPFCTASYKLFDTLVEMGVIDSYSVYILDKDFDNETLGKLALWAGWTPDGGQSYPSKPQIFMKGEYIGGNFEFYKSKWNLGDGMPNLRNPMRF